MLMLFQAEDEDVDEDDEFDDIAYISYAVV